MPFNHNTSHLLLGLLLAFTVVRYSFATQVQLPHATELVDTLAQPAFVLPAQNFSDMHISEVLCNKAAFGIAIQCQGEWNIKEINGTFEAQITDSSVGLGMQLVINSTSGLVDMVLDTKCDTDIGAIAIEFEGGSVNSTLELAVEQYIVGEMHPTICNNFKELSETELTSLVQQGNVLVEQWADPQPQYPPFVNTTGLVTFQNNSYLGAIDYAVNTLVGANGPLGLNHLANLATNNTGTLLIPNVTEYLPKLHLDTLLPYTMVCNNAIRASLIVVKKLGNYGNITIGFYSMNVSGLNTWSNVDLFEPVDDYSLDFTTALSGVRLSVHFYIDLDVLNGSEPTEQTAPTVHGEGLLKMNLSSTAFRTLFFMGLDGAKLQGLSANQLMSPTCILSSLVTLNLTVSDIEVIPFGFGDPTPADWLVVNFTEIMTTAFVPSYVAPLFNYILNNEDSGLLNLVNYGLLLATTNPEMVIKLLKLPPCAAPQGINTDTFNQTYTFFALIAAAGVFLVIGITTFVLKHRSKKLPEDRVPLVVGPKGTLVSVHGAEAIIAVDEIPFIVRYGVLALLLANIALFISSNSSVGASVYLVIKARGQEALHFPSLFDFSLVNSVRDMWDAKVYPLSILIAVFSGFWPYVKLGLLIMCWVIPFRSISVTHRERVLLILDALGKCSLIDSFVMILMMVAFHFSISPPVSPYTPAGTLVVQTWVEPHYGFYSFIAATICSLLTTHIIVRCHRTATNEVTRIEHDDKKSLLAYARRSRHFMFVMAVPLLLIVATALVILGLSIASFEFEFRGAFGYLLTLINQPTTTSYSVFSLGSGIPNSSDQPHSAGILFLQISFFIFICAMPLLYLVLLVMLWLIPFTYQSQRRLLQVTEIAQAWASLEVFVVAVIAALVELQQFAQFILGGRCDAINPILNKYFSGMLDGDDKCFDVAAYLKTGCWVTFSACLLYLAVGMIVIKSCHKALHDRLEDIKERQLIN